MGTFEQQLAKMSTHPGFVAALDQSPLFTERIHAGASSEVATAAIIKAAIIGFMDWLFFDW